MTRSESVSNIRTWPARIYLQQEERAPFSEHHEVTWCSDKINEHDVEYVRIDLYNSLRAQLKRGNADGTPAQGHSVADAGRPDAGDKSD